MKDAENARKALVRQKRLLEIIKKDSEQMKRINLVQKLEEIIALNKMIGKNIEFKND